MSGTRITMSLPPNIDVTKASVAYGDRALPKLNRELQSGDLLTQHQALRSLADMLRDPQNVKAAITNGIVESTRQLLAHDEASVRQLSAVLLLHIASHAVGRQAALELGVVDDLAKRYDDADVVVRQEVHAIMERLTLIADGQAALHEAKLVPKLIEKLVEEENNASVLVGIIDTLHNSMKLTTMPCLENDAMGRLAELCKRDDLPVLKAALRAVANLSFAAEGKVQAVSCGVIETLVQRLSHEDSDIRRLTSAALMSICITTPGKLEALKHGVVDVIAPLVTDEDEGVALASIKAVTVIAEAPRARQTFAALLPALQKAAAHVGGAVDPNAIKRAAETAIKTITWRP